jgi:hypothetical protein
VGLVVANTHKAQEGALGDLVVANTSSETSVGTLLSHPIFKPKPNAYSMCAQESSLHTYHTKNGYRITNIVIYSIFTE